MPAWVSPQEARYLLSKRRVPLEGKAIDPDTGKEVWITKLAQVYPLKLCQLYAQAASFTGLLGPTPPLFFSYLVCNPANERKRPGSPTDSAARRSTLVPLAPR